MKAKRADMISTLARRELLLFLSGKKVKIITRSSDEAGDFEIPIEGRLKLLQRTETQDIYRIRWRYSKRSPHKIAGFVFSHNQVGGSCVEKSGIGKNRVIWVLRIG